jgi:hypothetical protein
VVSIQFILGFGCVFQLAKHYDNYGDSKMNERIRLLAEQAGSTHKQNLGVYQFYTDELEKFAELIVRECYEHCKGQVLDKEVADTNELTYNDAVSDCANGLLQHFGVEE